MPFVWRRFRRIPLHCAVTYHAGDLGFSNLVLTNMECFSSATNLFGFLRLFEVIVE